MARPSQPNHRLPRQQIRCMIIRARMESVSQQVTVIAAVNFQDCKVITFLQITRQLGFGASSLRIAQSQTFRSEPPNYARDPLYWETFQALAKMPKGNFISVI